MVMPCSRSARRPSVTKDRSTSPRPRRSDAVEMASTWSSKSCSVSNRRRPTRVLSPSSTDPIVAKRNRSMVSAPSSCPPSGGELGILLMLLEVPLALAVLHGGLGEPVVAPGGAPLGNAGDRDLADDVLDGGRLGAHGAGQRGVGHGAIAHGGLLLDL